VVLAHQLDSVRGLGLVAGRNLVLEWLLAPHPFGVGPNEIWVDFVLLILLLEEVSDKFKHSADIVVRAAEMGVLLDRLLEHFDLITEFGNVI